MANYFTTRNELSSKKNELLKALEKIYEIESDAHRNYLRELEDTIAKHPNLTAAQYAAILGKTEEERESIRLSIGMMGYMAEAWSNDKVAYRGSPVCNCPSMPDLCRKKRPSLATLSKLMKMAIPLVLLKPPKPNSPIPLRNNPPPREIAAFLLKNLICLTDKNISLSLLTFSKIRV